MRGAPTVLLASCADLPGSDGDDALLPAALADVGVHASWAVWDDATAGFDQADLVVLRSTWDYARRRAEFLKWCESLPALANPEPVVRWNTDKAYLVDLAARGIAVVPTQLVRLREDPDWPDGEIVLKPSVGAGSRGAARFDGTERAAARTHLEALHSSGLDVLLQPYQAAVDLEGETALVFLGGVFSHAFAKGPMLAESSALDGSGLFVGERIGRAEPAPDLRRVAEDALDAMSGFLGVTRSELVYARVDLVRGADGGPLLLELELAEPSLGFRHADVGAPLRFASAVRAALARS